MTNFTYACPAIQRVQGSGFLSEGSSWLTAYMSEQRRFWQDCADASREGSGETAEYQIRLTWPILFSTFYIASSDKSCWQKLLYEPPHDKTNKMICAPSDNSDQPGHPLSVLNGSSQCAQWVAEDPMFLHVDSEDSDQTGRMPRLIWVFAGCTDHFVGFVMRWLIFLTCVIWSVLFFMIKLCKVGVVHLLYPRHLCRGVYSFHPFVCLFVGSFVCSFVCPWFCPVHGISSKFYIKGSQPLIRRHSYLDHRYPGGSAFFPWPLGQCPGVGLEVKI